LICFFLAKEDNDDPEYKLLQKNGYKIKLPDQPFYSIFYGISNICLAVTYSYAWIPDTFDSLDLLITVVSTRAILWDLPAIKNLLSDKSKKQRAS
jgi:hypothetical protein